MSPETPPIVGDQSAEALKRELAQAREQHTTFAEILKVISTSPVDPRDAFAAIATSAARLWDAYDAAIHRVDGNLLNLVAPMGRFPAPVRCP